MAKRANGDKDKAKKAGRAAADAAKPAYTGLLSDAKRLVDFLGSIPARNADVMRIVGGSIKEAYRKNLKKSE
jgi:hypothetical protein